MRFEIMNVVDGALHLKSKFVCDFKILSFSNNLLQDAYIIFQNNVDNFQTGHKNMLNVVWGEVPLK